MSRRKAYESHPGSDDSGAKFLIRRKDGETSYASVWSWDNTGPDRDDSPVWCMVYMRGLQSTFYGSAEGMRDLGERLIAAADAADGKQAPAEPTGYTGEIKVGDLFVWEPNKPHAREEVRVTALEFNADNERMVQSQPTRFLPSQEEGRYWNDEDRFREACVPLSVPAAPRLP